ncbi:MAG: flavodoxin domain-containing protein [Microgenomates group bacterium]
MKILVIYDSTFGNTKTIAETIAKNLHKEAQTKYVLDVSANDLRGVDVLIVGAPIIAWKPSENMFNFLSSLKDGQLKGIKVTSFDTRVKLFHGDAAKQMLNTLQDTGGQQLTPPQYFYVKGKEGPLFSGEVEKAATWAKTLANLL